MDPLHACIALGPVAVYLLVLGSINLLPRPLVTTGTRDAIALALAISGLVIAGPMELFLVEAAVAQYGGWIWVMMIGCYALMALLVALMLRPRLVIYNVTSEQLLPVLEEVLARLDPQVRWVGGSIVSQHLGVELHLEPHAVTKNIQLVSTGGGQSLAGWRLLEKNLAASLSGTAGAPNPWGASLISIGLLIAGFVTWMLADDPAAVERALNDMLRR